MREDGFTNILNRLEASDEEAWSSIRSHIEIILSTWAKGERIELDWVASDEKIANAEHVIWGVYSRFRKELMSGGLKVESYADYKRAVFSYCQEILEDQYARFLEMVKANNHKAWQRIHERLYVYAAKWLSERRIEGEAARFIFQESLYTLFEKLRSGELHFETSREFKSYYFKILEFKSMEDSRKRLLQKRRTEVDPDHLLMKMPEDPFEADDKYYLIENIMLNSISEDEAFILKHYYFHGEKLSEIAQSLHISDGNCRQKKLHALRKIATLYDRQAAKNKAKVKDRPEGKSNI